MAASKSLKKTTRQLLRIARRERPKAIRARMSLFGLTRKQARKSHADALRDNRKTFGAKAQRGLVLEGHGYVSPYKTP